MIEACGGSVDDSNKQKENVYSIVATNGNTQININPQKPPLPKLL